MGYFGCDWRGEGSKDILPLVLIKGFYPYQSEIDDSFFGGVFFSLFLFNVYGY